MSKFKNVPLLDQSTLKKLDADFFAKRSSELESLNIPRIEPESDPFGMGYSWLDEPEPRTKPEPTFVQPRSLWLKAAGRIVRDIALTGSLAGSTDEQVFENWIRTGFVALCYANGAEGETVLETVRSREVPAEKRVEALSAWFATLSKFQQLTNSDRLAISIAVVERFAESNS